VIGPLLNVNEGDSRTMFSLADGTSWARDNDQFRTLYDLRGENTLFVAGHDNQGDYVLLVGDQDGLPEDCKYALRYGGRDWGDSIESQGLLWQKAPGFSQEEAVVNSGEAYPENAGFCLDDQGRIASVYLARPPSASEGVPIGSASTS